METKTVSDLGPLVTIRYAANGQESVAQVDQFPCLIGRDSSSVQLALPDATVSRVHARLTCQDGAVLLENISTTNKTAVNGQFIESPVPIHTGDQAILGSCRLFFEIQPRVIQPESATVDAADETEAYIPEQPAAEPADKAAAPIPKQSVSGTAPEPGARYCRNCGKKMPAGAAFCGECGTPAGDKSTEQQFMFCGSCGAKISQDSQFCQQCGSPVGQGKRLSSASRTALSPKPSVRKKHGKHIVAALLVIAVIVAAVALFGGRGSNAVVKQYIDASITGDFTKMWKLFPKEVQEGILDLMEETFGVEVEDISEVAGLLEDRFDDMRESAEEEYGKDLKYSYEIVEERDLSTLELKELKRGLQYVGADDIEIDAGKYVDAELTLKLKDEKVTQTLTICVIKIGRSWYLCEPDPDFGFTF